MDCFVASSHDINPLYSQRSRALFSPGIYMMRPNSAQIVQIPILRIMPNLECDLSRTNLSHTKVSLTQHSHFIKIAKETVVCCLFCCIGYEQRKARNATGKSASLRVNLFIVRVYLYDAQGQNVFSFRRAGVTLFIKQRREWLTEYAFRHIHTQVNSAGASLRHRLLAALP